MKRRVIIMNKTKNTNYILMFVASFICTFTLVMLAGCSKSTDNTPDADVTEVATYADAAADDVTEADETEAVAEAVAEAEETEEVAEAESVTLKTDGNTEKAATEAGTTEKADSKSDDKTASRAAGGSVAETKKTTESKTTQATTQKATTQTTTQAQATTQAPVTTQAQATTQAPATTQKATTEATTQHVHNYNQIVYGTRTVHHDAVTHTEQQTVTETYNAIICSCGKVFDSYHYPGYGAGQAAYKEHNEAACDADYTGEYAACGSYATDNVQIEVPKTVTVTDKEAYDEEEKYIKGYKCSCGDVQTK
jgi:hypothetical protein